MSRLLVQASSNPSLTWRRMSRLLAPSRRVFAGSGRELFGDSRSQLNLLRSLPCRVALVAYSRFLCGPTRFDECACRQHWRLGDLYIHAAGEPRRKELSGSPNGVEDAECAAARGSVLAARAGIG